ncbi:MAG: DDE-type integrase/transposase/recombinase [Candidatus Bathyarchaeia archaeon]
MKTSNTRKLRAYSLLAHGKVDKISDSTYRVWSQTEEGKHYIVVREGLEWKCECPDFVLNHVACKHIHAVQQIRLNEQVAFPLEKEGENLCKEVESPEQVCKFCGSQNIVKRGYRNTQNGKVQRFFCKDCKRKFIIDEGFERMKATPETVTVALDLYFKGISMRAIVDHIKQFYGVEVSHVAIYKWIRKYVSMMKKYCDQLVPKVSGIWHSDEMTLNIKDLDNHENLRWAWNVIDNESRFWLASQITEKREIADARQVLAQASSLSKTRPMAIVTDGLRSYQDAIAKEFYTMKAPRTEHVRIPNIRDRSNNNMIERLHGTIRQRNKVMRGLDDEETAQTMMDGLRIYYNFMRPHIALGGKTPAQQAKIADSSTPENWKSLIKKATKVQKPL